MDVLSRWKVEMLFSLGRGDGCGWLELGWRLLASLFTWQISIASITRCISFGRLDDLEILGPTRYLEVLDGVQKFACSLARGGDAVLHDYGLT